MVAAWLDATVKVVLMPTLAGAAEITGRAAGWPLPSCLNRYGGLKYSMFFSRDPTGMQGPQTPPPPGLTRPSGSSAAGEGYSPVRPPPARTAPLPAPRAP